MNDREVIEEAKRILKQIMGRGTMHKIDLRMELTGVGIKILGIPFAIYTGDGALALKPSGPRGVIATHLGKSMKSSLKKRGISFLTLDGDLYISLPDYALALTTRKRLPTNEPGRLMLRPPGAISPTALLSPYAFDILDVLFRLKEQELSRFESANRFAREFNLNQPKLSLMMTAFRANNLLELRNKVRDIPPDWWRHALDYPAVRKRLTPFFQAAKPYYSRAVGKPSDRNSSVIPGPPELLKAVGLIREQSFYYWVEPDQEKALKKEMLAHSGKPPGLSYLVSRTAHEVAQKRGHCFVVYPARFSDWK